MKSDSIQIFGKLKALVIDVDGVMTNGMKYYSDSGSKTVAFNVKDGVAISILKDNGILPIVISASDFKAVELRMKDISISHYYLNCSDKLEKLREILKSLNIRPEETAVIGDDIPDLPLFSFCGVSAAPSDAASAVLDAADVKLNLKGGAGVLRELVEMIIPFQPRASISDVRQ